MGFNETMVAAGWHGVAENLLAIKLSREWQRDYASWEDYCERRWGLPRTHANGLIKFANFKEMCRESRAPVPESYWIVMPLLRKPQKKWLEIWEIVCTTDHDEIDAAHVRSVMEVHGYMRRRQLSPVVLNSINAKRGIRALNQVTSPDDVRGVDPSEVRSATNTCIDIDQAVMNR